MANRKADTSATLSELRGRKQSPEERNGGSHGNKRPRSFSRSSSSSIATISTKSSQSEASSMERRRRRRRRQRQPDASPRGRDRSPERATKRRRSISSGSADEPAHSQVDQRNSHDRERSRHTRLRRQSTSPAQRGRRKGRSPSPSMQSNRPTDNARPYKAGVVDRSYKDDRHDKGGRRFQHRDASMQDHHEGYERAEPQIRPKERSLSPYSKRIALSQGMRNG